MGSNAPFWGRPVLAQSGRSAIGQKKNRQRLASHARRLKRWRGGYQSSTRRFTPVGFSLVLAALRGDQLALIVGVSSRRPSTLLAR